MNLMTWTQVADEAIERLTPYAPVILMGLESVRRTMGRHVERVEFVTAKSVYALLKTTFERDGGAEHQQLLDQFVLKPDRHRTAITRLVAEKASYSPGDFGHKLIALTNRWRNNKRPLPPAT